MPLRLRAAWDSGDADSLADLFTDDGTHLVEQLIASGDQVTVFDAGPPPADQALARNTPSSSSANIRDAERLAESHPQWSQRRLPPGRGGRRRPRPACGSRG